MKQGFNDKVEQVVQATTVTQIHHHEKQGRRLTRAERSELNAKVKLLETRYAENGRETWRFVYHAIGVQCLDEMCIENRDGANAILDLMIERADLKDSQNPLLPDEMALLNDYRQTSVQGKQALASVAAVLAKTIDREV